MLIMSYKEFTQVFRCKNCGMIVYDSSTKISKYSLFKRILIGILTLAISEIYCKQNRLSCPNCHNKNLIKSK